MDFVAQFLQFGIHKAGHDALYCGMFLIVLMASCALMLGVEGASGYRPRPSSVGLGAVFTINDVWLQSDNGAFQLEIRQWEHNHGLSQCMAGVRYTYKTPAALIWSFNIDVPQPWNGTDCTLELTPDGDFRANLTLANGTTIMPWHSGTSNIGVYNLALRDDGNLVLVNRHGIHLWQSFGTFTDLFIIPSGMKFFRNNTLHERDGVSEYSDFTVPGRVALRINDQQNNLMLFTTDNNFVYYSFGLSSPLPSTSRLEYITLDEDINFYDSNSSLLGSIAHNRQGGVLPNRTSLVGSAFISDHGNFLTNYLNFTTTKHTWYYNSSIAGFCDYPFACGDYNLCNEQTRECNCPPGFRNKKGRGSSCIASDPKYSLYPINIIVRNQFVSFTVNSQFHCRDLCIQNISCNAAIFDASMKSCAHFSIIHTIRQVADNSTGQIMFLKIHNKRPQESVSIGGIISTIMVALLLILSVSGFIWHRKYHHGHSQKEEHDQLLLKDIQRRPPRYSYKDLKLATRDFTKKLGEGGFASVYEGVLTISGVATTVAVKKLDSARCGAGQSTEQFKVEVATIGSVSHINLVKLYGFCIEEASRCLVYEFMGKGSLDMWLFHSKHQPSMETSISLYKDRNSKSGSNNSRASHDKQLSQNLSNPFDLFPYQGNYTVLNWEIRCRIALDTAKALEYLHHQSADHIVHCDIKPQNILLDDKFNAKVADFGLAKLIATDKESFTMTTLKGTRGYLAPEWLLDSSITTKSDVYSYGVVLLELITGRRAIDPHYGHLTTWVLRMVREACSCKSRTNTSFKDELTEISTNTDIAILNSLRDSVLDERLQKGDRRNVSPHSFQHILGLALACVEREPSKRPSMVKVVQSLDYILQQVGTDLALNPAIKLNALHPFSMEPPLMPLTYTDINIISFSSFSDASSSASNFAVV